MADHDEFYFLEGGGAMAAAIRAYDWASTSLGPLDGWPPSLRMAVGMMLGSRFPKCIVWGPDLVTLYNDAFRPILGEKPEALGRSFQDVWHEAWGEIGPILVKAYAGEATFIEDFPLVVDRHGYPEQAYFTFCYSPLRDETGRVAGMMDTVIETTGKVESERHARFLNAELSHRIRNTLAMVAAIARQTFASAGSKEHAEAAFTARLVALGRAHDILTQSSWRNAPIRTVVEGALAPHRTGAGRISIEGPPVELSAKQSLSLSLAINELATNAAKYGSLSGDRGRVDVSWLIDGPGAEEIFRFRWVERDGPQVREPSRRGFGSKLIERALAADFQGEVTITYDPAGLHCELTARLADLQAEADE